MAADWCSCTIKFFNLPRAILLLQIRTTPTTYTPLGGIFSGDRIERFGFQMKIRLFEKIIESHSYILPPETDKREYEND